MNDWSWQDGEFRPLVDLAALFGTAIDKIGAAIGNVIGALLDVIVQPILDAINGINI